MKIYTKEAAPSLGKTYGSVRHIKESGGKWIIASISKELGKQTYKLCKELGLPDVMIINSDSDYVGGTFNRFKEALRNEEADVIIITHALLEMTYKQDIDFTGYNLLIDEVPNNFVKVDVANQIIEDETTIIMQYLTNTGVKQQGNWVREIFRLRQGKRDALTERVEHLKNRKDNTLSPKMLGLYEYLLLGGAIQRWQKETDNYQACYCFIKVVNPLELFDKFDKVILIASNIKTTLVGKVWSQVFKVSFEDYSGIKLKSDTLPNTDKITIYPMLKDLNISRYLLNKPVGDETIFDLLLSGAMDIIGDEPFTYVVNNYRDVDLKGQRVPVQAHGLNSYSHISNSVCLFSYNPDAFTKAILEDLAEHFNLDNQTFVDGYVTSNYLESTFQNATRGKIRDHNCTEPVKVVVGDMRCANYLINTWFKDATIDDTKAIELPEKSKGGRPPSFQKLFDMNASEKGKFSRMKKKLEHDLQYDNVQDYEFVRKWIKDIRGIED